MVLNLNNRALKYKRRKQKPFIKLLKIGVDGKHLNQKSLEDESRHAWGANVMDAPRVLSVLSEDDSNSPDGKPAFLICVKMPWCFIAQKARQGKVGGILLNIFKHVTVCYLASNY